MEKLEEYCCEELMEYKGFEWVRFMDCYEEELAETYECSKCGRRIY
jgi:hypothetical protein